MAENKTEEILKKLEDGIIETLNSKKFKNFLKVQSQFHSYSFNNAMLIYLQNPLATRVAGYKTWQKLERQVLKGEKGIGIIAPHSYKYKKLVDMIDSKTGKPIKDSVTGETKKIYIEVEGMKFRKVNVFDIKQTDGKELPTLCDELQGNSVNAESIIKAIKQLSNVPIIEENIDSGAKGYYNPVKNIIVLKKDMSLDQKVKTLIHEYTHSQLHNLEAKLITSAAATKEIQAESVAYIVTNNFGIDTSEYSFEYVASWSSGKELAELKESFNIIQKTSDKMIQGIEGVLNKEIELQNKIIKLYKKDFTAIKYISSETATIINNFNQEYNKTLSIKEIKNYYNKLGKEIENNNMENIKSFKELDTVINDFKQAKFKEQKSIAHEKAIQNNVKEKTIELNM